MALDHRSAPVVLILDTVIFPLSDISWYKTAGSWPYFFIVEPAYNSFVLIGAHMDYKYR